MITTTSSTKFWQRSWFAALIGGLAVGAGVWWLESPHDAEQATEVSSAASGVAGVAARTQPSATFNGASLANPTILPDGRPSDFSPEDWAALKAAMSSQPNSKAELERVVSYLRFQRGFEQWQALADSRDVQRRHQIAEALLSQVPDRLRKGEVTVGEALLVSTALLTDLEPDEQRREQRVAELNAKLTAAAPQADDEQVVRDAERQAEFKRRQAAIVAEWQAKPDGSRDQAKLEQDLESARRAVYSDSNP